MTVTIKTGRKLYEVNSKGFVIGSFTFTSHTFANRAFVGGKNVLEVNGRYFIRTI